MCDLGVRYVCDCLAGRCDLIIGMGLGWFVVAWVGVVYLLVCVGWLELLF